MPFQQVLGVTFLLVLCQYSEALKCYECNSYHTSGCDHLDISQIVAKTCLPTESSCKIIRQDAPFKTDSKAATSAPGTRVYRGCSNVTVAQFGSSCLDRVGTDKVKIRYCLCNTDGCNKSPSVWSPSSWIIISLLTCFTWFVSSDLI